MSINILETVQQNLGYPALQKIDPNTQQVLENDKTPNQLHVSQAAIPAVLTGFYRYVQSDEGAENFLRGNNSSSCLNKIFDKNKIEVVQTIATYTNQSKLDPLAEMEVIANETVKVVKNILGADASIKEVKTYFSGQKNNILLYLPAVLNIGELLNDSTLDDKTNKMEGPLSSLMQNIGSAFSKPVSDEETKNL